MVTLLLDEHVSRVFESTLTDRGFDVQRAREALGESATDRALLEWCSDHEAVLISNNVRDFEAIHHSVDHFGVLLYRKQDLPDKDPEGLVRTVELVFQQYGRSEVQDQLVELDEWYEWLQM